MLCRSERPAEEVIIALVGKYTALEDAYASVLKALSHAAVCCSRKLNVQVRIYNSLNYNILIDFELVRPCS